MIVMKMGELIRDLLVKNCFIILDIVSNFEIDKLINLNAYK